MSGKYKKGKCSQKETLFVCGVSFLTVFLMWCLFFYWKGYAPFGGNSLAWSDGNIQYIDFFAYLKDVLEGQNNIGYTFSKELGGTNIGTFSYYLASPFNFMVVFFEKENLHTFFDLLVALKLSTAAAACAYFFRKRFSEELHTKYIILLSVSYAFMQYSIAQASNVMWLDGVYMLPLILLGVYWMIKRKTIVFLSISVGAAILFNWYSAGIDCMFAIAWFFFEMFLDGSESVERKETFQDRLGHIFRFGCSMSLGIVLSAVLFLPTISAMKDSSRGEFDWELFKNEFMGDIVSVLQNFNLSATSTWGSVSLFCGELALLGCIAFFFSKKIRNKQKLAFGSMLGITVLFFHWIPFVTLFSLFKEVGSYWYRYSYAGIFLILFIAAHYYEKHESEEKEIPRLLVRCAAGFSVFQLLLNYIHPVWNPKYVYATAAVMMGIAVLLERLEVLQKESVKKKKVGAILLVFFVCTEMMVNTELLTRIYHVDDVETFKEYYESPFLLTDAIL